MTNKKAEIEIISCHIPKTGGITFKDILLDIYGANNVLMDYKDKIDYPAELYNKYPASWEIKNEQKIRHIKPNIKVIHGHFALHKYNNHFPLAKRISWVRNPVNRLISNYFFLISKPPESADYVRKKMYELQPPFSQFIENPQSQNVLTRYLKGVKIEDFFFLGILENFEAELEVLRNAMNWPANISLNKKNKNPHSKYDKEFKNILSDKKLVEKIESLNSQDVSLYKEAIKFSSNRASLLKPEKYYFNTSMKQDVEKLIKNHSSPLTKKQIDFFEKPKPLISVIVVLYNMEREIARTLYSLSTNYQKGITESEYEVIIVDNGSKKPLEEKLIKSFGYNFNYFYIKNASSSPSSAINFGAKQAKGRILGVMIDGARIITPGVLKYAKLAAKLYPDPITITYNWHLGPDIQSFSITKGYNKNKEDKLLKKIDWKRNGYKLFEASTPAKVSGCGWFMPPSESNCYFIKKETFEKIKGYDEKFNMEAGGLVNNDTYKRLCEVPGTNVVVMLGEGSFHQLHNGLSTNADPKRKISLISKFKQQYKELRKAEYTRPTNKLFFIGQMPPEAGPFLEKSINKIIGSRNT